ncbi:piggyBac transposable element-derived protein 4 [Trichonephila clavipes]|nr:piggyBac transposable element-derived protein 4 [Trichonephila clavipes]
MTSVNETKIDGTNEKLPCPKDAVVYNDVMGRVNLFNQRKERYQIRRSVKWWHRIFYFLFTLSSYIVSYCGKQIKETHRSLDHLTFVIVLARQLIDGYSSRNNKGHPANFQEKQCVVPDDMRFASVGIYMPKRAFQP